MLGPILAVVLVVGGLAAMFVSFGGAMTDGTEPTWAAPTGYTGLASFVIGILLVFYFLINFAVNFWHR